MGKEDFWQEYHAVVLGNGVPEAKAEWFVKWAQRFERFPERSEGVRGIFRIKLKNEG